MGCNVSFFGRDPVSNLFDWSIPPPYEPGYSDVEGTAEPYSEIVKT
jgi:hypothetical protein